MIIPPDPEKDPRLFDPSASTSSLVPPPSESDANYDHDDDSATISTTSHIAPSTALAARRHPRSIGGHHDDLGLGYVHRGEALPPYIDRSPPPPPPTHAHPSRARLPSQARIVIPPLPSSQSHPIAPSPADTDTHNLTPTLADPSSSRHSLAIASTSKLWESSSLPSSSSSSSSTSPKRRKILFCLPISKRQERWWKKWRRWVYALLVCLVVGLGLMIGLLVGFKVGRRDDPSGQSPRTPWADKSPDGKMSTKWSADTDGNLTFVDARDAPGGYSLTSCNIFTPLNHTSAPFTTLVAPFPAASLTLSTFTFNLTYPSNTSNISLPSLLGDFGIMTRGLGSSGTVQVIGSDAADETIDGGYEGATRVDVVVRYNGEQDLSSIMRVCQMQSQTNGSYGIGVFSPSQTDGKTSSPFALDPSTLPSLQIVVRLPPSVIRSTSPAMSIPSFTLDLERASAQFGAMTGVEFERWNVSTGRGSVGAGYVKGDSVAVSTGAGSVAGKWNITQNIALNNTDGPVTAQVFIADLPPSAANETTYDNSTLVSRGLPKLEALLPDMSPNRTVALNLTSGSGPISLSVAYQPPRTALQTFIGAQQGDVDLSLSPNYIGPFLVKSMWGVVSIMPPTGDMTDPEYMGRYRKVVMGDVDVESSAIFAKAGVRNADVGDSGSIVTGAAYWWKPPSTKETSKNGTQVGTGELTAAQVQSGLEGQGSDVGVFAAWGDVRMRFDGT